MAIVSATGSGVFAAGAKPGAASTALPKTISMTALPYAEDALAPFISARTVGLHYHKHHKSYYELLTKYIESHADFQNMSLEELLIRNRNGILFDETMFDVSVLLNNHNYYWPSLKPKSGGRPSGEIGRRISDSYGSYEAFRKNFIEQAMKLGVGWVWVVQDKDKILAYRSEYHDTPLVKGHVPLLAIDVWEHSYYLDYANDRQKYVEAVLDNLINWDFAEKNLAKK